MVSIIKRMRKLRTLLAIRVGPGAAILPPEVTKIHMDFALRIEDGHAGAKKFWRQCLPRLKYHNPSVPMTIERSPNQKGPSTMTVTFSSLPSPDSSTAPTSRTEVINMKNKSVSIILTRLMELTKARTVRTTPEEQRQMQEFEEQQEKSEKVRMLMTKETERIKREKEMLEQSRGVTVGEENLA